MSVDAAAPQAGPFDAFSKHFTLNGVDYNQFQAKEVGKGRIWGYGNNAQINADKEVVAVIKKAVEEAKAQTKTSEDNGFLYNITIAPIVGLVNLVMSAVSWFFNLITCNYFAAPEKKEGPEAPKTNSAITTPVVNSNENKTTAPAK